MIYIQTNDSFYFLYDLVPIIYCIAIKNNTSKLAT